LEQTDLIAVLPKHVVSDGDHRLFLCPPPIKLASVALVAAWPERLNEDPLHKWFRKICFEHTRKVGAGD
jgi:DNA-binding transcriptional LysR family regulator